MYGKITATAIERRPSPIASVTLTFDAGAWYYLLSVLKSHANNETFQACDGKWHVVSNGCAATLLKQLEEAVR